MTSTVQCNAVVWKRDTYRRTGRGKTGFELHYKKCRCQRKAVLGDLCRQHATLERAKIVVRWVTS